MQKTLKTSFVEDASSFHRHRADTLIGYSGWTRSLSPVSSICRTSVARPLTTMSRWVFGLDFQREVDQRWRPGTRLPKVRAQGCSHAERSNLRNVKEFSQTKGEVRATDGSRLVHFSFSGQSEWTPFSVQEDLCAERHTHKLPSGMSERTEVPSGTPRAQGGLFPRPRTRLLEVKSTRLLPIQGTMWLEVKSTRLLVFQTWRKVA